MKPLRQAGVVVRNCHPLSTGPGLLSFLRWCAGQVGWLRHFDNPRRRIDIWVLAGPLSSRERQPAWGMAGGRSSAAVRDLSATWFHGAEVFLPLNTMYLGSTLAETFVHELQHCVDFMSGELSRMTRNEGERRAYGAERQFWKRAHWLEVFLKFESLAAGEVRGSLKALVRLSGNPGHIEMLRQMHFRAIVAACLDVLEERHDVIPSEDVLATVVDVARRAHALGLRYDASLVTRAALDALARGGKNFSAPQSNS